MGPGIRARLVEANSGNETVRVGSEFHPQIGSGGIGAINKRWSARRVPDTAGASDRNRDARGRSFQIAAVIYGAALDGHIPSVQERPCVAPVFTAGRRMPGGSSILRDFDSSDDATTAIGGRAGNRYRISLDHVSNRRFDLDGGKSDNDYRHGRR